MKSDQVAAFTGYIRQLPSTIQAVLVMVVFVVAGAVVIGVNAETASIATEPEAGTINGSAARVSDATASASTAVKFSSSNLDPIPQPPASWQAAWDSSNQTTLDAWYGQNTGYAGLELDPGTFRDISADNLIDQAWLNANQGNGNVSQSNGRWIVERVRSGRIRIAVNNVTIRGCYITGGGTTLYGIQNYPTFSNSVTGTVIENCTLNGQATEGTGILMSTQAAGITSIIVRNNDVYGWGTGIDMRGNITAEYNRVHDLHYYTGSHNASAVNRNANVRIYRNSLEDGNSSALSLYADSLVHNMIVQENVFNTPKANYCINFPSSKQFFDQTYDAHLIDNKFGQKHNPRCGSSGPMAGGKWTTVSGNTYMDGSPI